MAHLLVSDTNSAIKLAFLRDKFFQDNFLSIGTLALWADVVSSEVKVHLSNPDKQSIFNELNFLKTCGYYYDFEFDEYEFYSYQASEFSDAEDVVRSNGWYLGTCDNDQKVLFIALTNKCGLVTNEYALADLSRATLSLPDMSDCTSTLVYTAEDLVLCAYSENKLTFIEVQDLIERWIEAGEHIMAIKKQDFINKGFKIAKK